MESPYAVKLAESTTYLNKNIAYLKNTEITEYDIKSAGFSCIKFNKLLPKDEIENLEKMDKETRNIAIGKRSLQIPNMNKSIIETLAKVRKAFVILNHLEDVDILAIKKDALFIIKKRPEKLLIQDAFLFREKNTYTSYLYLNGIEFYYNSFLNKLDVKGIPEESREVQKDFFLKDIRKIMKMSEKFEDERIYQYLKEYRSKYLNKELPIETYRDLNSALFSMGKYQIKSIDKETLKDIDISQNYINFLLPLFKAIL